jgi:heat shock protein 90kDa beta
LPPYSSSQVSGSEHGAPQFQKRLFTLLSGPNSFGFDKYLRSNLSEIITINRRYESNAAAVDSSDSACEKLEYQAEVPGLICLTIFTGLYSEING